MTKKESINKEKIFYYKILPAYNINEELVYSSTILFLNGTIVRINLRGKDVYGCVISRVKNPEKIKFTIKSISFCLKKNKIKSDIIKFISWFSMYNLVSRGYVLKQFLPNEKIVTPRKEIIFKKNKKKLIENFYSSDKKTDLFKLLEKESKTLKELLNLNFKKNYIKQLVHNKFLIEAEKIVVHDFIFDKKKIKLKKLNKNQTESYAYIKKKIKLCDYKPIFLDGITGSGKTEVYFKIIKYYLLLKKQILILLPEIGLAHQWIDRFKKVFNFLPLNWNSSVSNNEKNKIWQTVSIGRPVVVVGTRSALFLPFTKLGLTIIDEENDMSYKQEDSLIYNARDMAIVRAKFTSSHLLLVSATPSLETYWNSLKKKYNYTRISKRYGISTLPKIELINMYKEKGKIFSTKTQSEIKKNLQEGKQTLILINRRGYAPITLCVKCGRTQKCLHCDINLVLHKKSQLLVCHHCGYSKNINSQCEFCKGKGNFIHVGIGIERVLEEAKKIFDTKSLIALSSDTFNSKTFIDTLKKIENNEIKILIATQIISKGFNFLHLNKVFILDFDMWFYNSDIRTSEKIFQLTQQVAGRAGRGNEPGKVYIQTYDIENSLLTKIKNNDRENFYKEELLFRERTLLPPFSKLVAIILQGKNFKDVESSSYKIKNLLSSYSGLTILGPIPAPIEFLNKQYRYRILIKSEHSLCIQKKVKSKVLQSLISSGIRIKIDVDPYSFF